MGELWQWWNLIYAVPLIIAVLYLGVSVTFGLLEGSDADHEADHDVDHDLEADTDADVEAEADAEADHDADHDAESDHGVDPAALLLMAIGARHVTTGLAVQFLLLSWGAIGLLVNHLLAGWLVSPKLFLGPSLLITALLSVGTTRVCTTVLGKILPKDDTAAEPRSGLEGHVAQCLYAIDNDSGVAIVKDRFGHRHQVACRTRGEEIPRGAEVVLLEYVPERDYFVVEEVPDEWRPRESRQASGGAQDSPSVKTGA